MFLNSNVKSKTRIYILEKGGKRSSNVGHVGEKGKKKQVHTEIPRPSGMVNHQTLFL